MAEHLLDSVRVKDFTTPKDAKSVFHVESTQNVRDALTLMVSKNVYAIPAYEHDKCAGLITLRSVVTLLVRLFCKKAGIAENESPSQRIAKLTKYSFSTDELKAISEELYNHSAKELITKPFVPRHLDTTLREIILDLSHHERVAITDSNGKVIDLVSQAVVVKYLIKHVDKLGPKVNEKLENLGIVQSPVQTVSIGTPTLIAFARMVEEGFSSFGIVDEEKQIVGIISFKDIKGVVDDFRSLFHNVDDYINKIRRQDYRDVNPTVNCKSTDTLAKSMQKLDAVGIHRLFVSTDKDKGHQFSGILTLYNVLSVFVK